MTFSVESPVVQAWVRQVRIGTYEKESVPNIGNLREVVMSILDEAE